MSAPIPAAPWRVPPSWPRGSSPASPSPAPPPSPTPPPHPLPSRWRRRSHLPGVSRGFFSAREQNQPQAAHSHCQASRRHAACVRTPRAVIRPAASVRSPTHPRCSTPSNPRGSALRGRATCVARSSAPSSRPDNASNRRHHHRRRRPRRNPLSTRPRADSDRAATPAGTPRAEHTVRG